MPPRTLFDAVDALDPSRGLLVALDFDGTLCPYARRPENSRLPVAAKTLLARLSRQGRTHVAVLGGRDLADLRRRVGLNDLHYAGNYGLDISGPAMKNWRHRTAVAARPELNRLVRQIRKELAVGGIVIEPKALSVTVHYRLANPEYHELVRRSLFKMVHVESQRFRVIPGPGTWEVRPRARWSKAHAVALIAERLDYPQIVYAGDAPLDEEAFRKLGPEALTVRVGGTGPTSARFRVNDPSEVRSLLERLCRFPAPIR